MITLIAHAQDASTQTTLDLSEASSVSLSYSIAELGDVTGRNSPFSQDFRLPQTEINNKFFEHWYNVHIATATFDARKKTRVTILDDGVQILAGYLELKGVLNTDESYNVAVFGDQANLYEEIEGKDLHATFVTDGIATTDYDYTANGQNTVDSWDLTNDITDGTVGDGVVMVPLIDWGKGTTSPLHYSLSGGSPFGLGASGYLQGNELKPGIQLKHLFDKILAQAGYSYTSTFLASDTFAKIYMQLGTNGAELSTVPYQGVNVGLSTNQTITEATEVAEFDTDSTGIFYDLDDLWDTSGFTFVAPSNMYITGSVKVVAANTSGSMAQFYCIVDTPSGVSSSPAWTNNGVVSTAFTHTYFFDDLYLEAGQELQVSFVVSEGTMVFQSGQSGSRFHLSHYVAPTGSTSVHLPTLLPNISQKDFLKDIIQRFNLILEVLPDNERHLLIEPWSDWVDAGSSIDWTKKIDLSKEVTVEPTNKYKKSIIDFRDKEGKDEGNRYWQDRQEWTYGRHYEQIDDDFAAGTLKNAPIFKPFHVHELPTLGGGDTILPSVLIGRQYMIEDQVYKRVADAPFLFYHNGLVDVGGTIYIGTTAATQYPYCSAYNETTDNQTTVSLYWGYQYPYSLGNPTFGEDYVHRNLFREYWGRFHNQIYDRQARLLTAYFNLTPTDILNLRFNDAIRVEGGIYRVLKVQGYKVNGYDTTKVELIKEVSGLKFRTSEECNHIPSVWNLDGTITFIEASTGATTLDPGEECCELHHGVWDGTNSRCYYLQPNGGGGHNLTGRRDRTPRTGNQETQENQTYRVGAVNATSRRTVLFAEADESSTVIAQGQEGEIIQVPNNTVLRVTANVTSTQTTFDGTNGGLGVTSVRQYFVLAKNIEGTVSAAITENVDVRTDDVKVTNRTVTASVAAKSGDYSSLVQDLHLRCTGETWGRVEFVLDCELTYTDLSRAIKEQTQTLTEAGETIVTEAGAALLQE